MNIEFQWIFAQNMKLFCFIKCAFLFYLLLWKVLHQQISIKTITRQWMLVFTLFEIYMWIVILTLIAQWPESQNSCCMIVFVVRIFWTWAVCSTFLLDTTSDRFFREVFEDLSLPKHCDGKYPLCVIKLILLNCTVRITLVLVTWKWMGVFLTKMNFFPLNDTRH